MFNFQTLIDEVVIKNNQYKGGQRDNAKFSVSDAGTCYRKRYLKRLGVPPTREIEVAALRKMLAGDAGHSKLQSLLKYQGKLYMSETELETDHIKGHPDAVVKNGVLSLVEIKTVEKFSLAWIKKQGAKPEHKMQMFTYWSLLRKDLPELNDAVLTYVKREDFEAHDYYFKWTPEIAKQVEDEWNPLIAYWNKKELPPCTCNVDYGGSGVKYCLYQQDELNCCDKDLVKQLQN